MQLGDRSAKESVTRVLEGAPKRRRRHRDRRRIHVQRTHRRRDPFGREQRRLRVVWVAKFRADFFDVPPEQRSAFLEQIPPR